MLGRSTVGGWWLAGTQPKIVWVFISGRVSSILTCFGSGCCARPGAAEISMAFLGPVFRLDGTCRCTMNDAILAERLGSLALQDKATIETV